MLYHSTNSLEILQELKKGSLILHAKGAEYSYSFFSYFLELASLQGIVVKHCSAQELNDYSALQKNIFDSSVPTLLFVGCLESVEQYKYIKNALLSQRNESICFFYDKSVTLSTQRSAQLDLNNKLTAIELQKLWRSFKIILPLSDEAIKYFSVLLTKRFSLLSVEQGCCILKYIPLLQHCSPAEIVDVVGSLFDDNYSLFELSGLFFSAQKALFFKQWSAVHATYPSVFWINYWSDQLFRAYCYIKAKMMSSAVPKHLSARLAFSFVNKDYALVNITTLIKIHSLLRIQDQRLKQGCSADITLILHTWFLDET